jgi:hypothetical protein
VETSLPLLTCRSYPLSVEDAYCRRASSQVLKHSSQLRMRSSPASASLSAGGDIDCWARGTPLTRTSHKGPPGGWSNNDLTRHYADANHNIGAATVQQPD